MPQSGVGHAGVPEVEPLEGGKAGDVAQGVVVGLGFAQIELLESLGARDRGQARAGDRRVADAKLPAGTARGGIENRRR